MNPSATASFDIASAVGEIASLLSTDIAAKDRSTLRQKVLEGLLGAGFERARFWERCPDNARAGEPILILVAETESDSGPSNANVGYAVEDKDSIRGYEGSKESVFVGDPTNFDEPPEWHELFEIEGRRWVDLALRAGDEVVGVMAMDWSDDRELHEEDLLALRAIGVMVGTHLQLRPQWRVREFREALATSTADRQSLTPQELVLEGAKIIGHTLDARLVAVFEHVWTTGKLHKRFEIDLRHNRVAGGRRNIDFFSGAEDWEVGERLTGTAWVNERKRHIPIFNHLEEDLADKDSKRRHRVYMGEDVNTCLYGYVGGTEPRYLLRFINRSGGEFMPFVGEWALLRELLTELRSDLDTCVAVLRTQNLEQATAFAAETSKVDGLMEQMAPLLEQEGVDDFAFLCHQGSPQFAYRGAVGKAIGSLRLIEGQEWKEDQLYADLISRPTREVAIPPYRSGSPLARHLADYGFVRLVSFPMKVGETAGTLVIPTEETGGKADDLLVKCGAARRSLFHAYGRLLADVVDTSLAHERAEGARQALGVLGHELASPLARLGTASELGLNKARDGAVDMEERLARGNSEAALAAADGIRKSTVAFIEKVSESRRSVGAAMALAPIVAKENNGRLELQFWDFNLGELVCRTVNDFEEELKVSFDGPPGRTYEFDVSQTVLKLGNMAGDAALLQHALLNLLRNAAKYSMTPGGGSTMCPIKITTERQQNMNIIVVHNWGRGILPEQMDPIFQPWTRFDEDADIARRGMGLGLFLARRIALAHGGTVLCRKSEHALNEVNRQARLDGFDTEFELRLPKDLDEGAYVHIWRAGEPIRQPERKPSQPLNLRMKKRRGDQ